MLLFIIIFFAMLIVVGVSAVLGFSVYAKRRTLFVSENQKQIPEPLPYRSLFEPSGEEIRALEREEQRKIAAVEKENDEIILREKAQAVDDFQKIWLAEPNKRNTAELFRLAATGESANLFSETAKTVIQVFRENRLPDLSATDLAGLLDSHFRILPQQERFSGAIFWLKQEIADLRRKSEEI